MSSHRQQAKMQEHGHHCGRNSVVECQLPKLDVAGSNPVARSDSGPVVRRGQPALCVVGIAKVMNPPCKGKEATFHD